MQPITDRLEALREKRRWTWKQLADALDLSVSMLMMVKRGDRELSKRAQWRLEDEEVKAGLRSAPSTTSVAEANPTNPDPHARRISQQDVNFEAMPRLFVLTGELAVADLESLISRNVAEMMSTNAKGKLAYLRLVALYLVELHKRLAAAAEPASPDRETPSLSSSKSPDETAKAVRKGFAERASKQLNTPNNDV